jgi:hypothetical protein
VTANTKRHGASPCCVTTQQWDWGSVGTVSLVSRRCWSLRCDATPMRVIRWDVSRDACVYTLGRIWKYVSTHLCMRQNFYIILYVSRRISVRRGVLMMRHNVYIILYTSRDTAMNTERIHHAFDAPYIRHDTYISVPTHIHVRRDTCIHTLKCKQCVRRDAWKHTLERTCTMVRRWNTPIHASVRINICFETDMCACDVLMMRQHVYMYYYMHVATYGV